MSELQKMEAPPAYDTTTSPAPVYNQTTSTTAPDPATSNPGQNTVVKVTTTAPTSSGGQFTSVWDQVCPVQNILTKYSTC